LTHSNSIKRFTVYVGVSYENDPNDALEVIRNAVANVPVVVKEPRFRVNLWEFADSAITFRIDYFINLQEAGIDDSRGAILLNIWNHLKQANIKIPYPQREVYVKWVPTEESE
jgi:potassium efflux system protein